MNKNDVEQSYKEIKLSWENNLKNYGVKLPNLKKGDSYCKSALVLIYLYQKIEKKVSKKELTNFLNKMNCDSNDVQQARHLAQQSGWYILSGTRKDSECSKFNVNPGEYMLKSIIEPYPSFKNMKRTEILNAVNWDGLKKIYGNRCATCGSKENEANLHYPASLTQLQQGHKDPSKPLSIDNTIPQCQFCNRASRNYFVFDNKGRVEKIYDPHFVLRSNKNIQEVMLKLLIEEDIENAKKIISEIEEK